MDERVLGNSCRDKALVETFLIRLPYLLGGNGHVPLHIPESPKQSAAHVSLKLSFWNIPCVFIVSVEMSCQQVEGNNHGYKVAFSRHEGLSAR